MDILLNWPWISLFAMIFAGIAHALMFKLQNRPLAHRWVVYVATLIGGLSLLMGLYQSDDQLAKWSRPTYVQQRKAALELLTAQLEWERQYYCDSQKPIRTQYSPANFDQIVAAEGATCETIKALQGRSRDWASSEADISLPELGAPHFGFHMPRQSAMELRKLVNIHNASAADLRRLDAAGAPSALLVTLTAFGPYLFIAAFMIGLASIMFPAIGEKAKPSRPRRLRRAKAKE